MKNGVAYCFNSVHWYIAQFLVLCEVLYSHGVIQCTGCALTTILIIILHVVCKFFVLFWYENFQVEDSFHTLKFDPLIANSLFSNHPFAGWYSS